MNIGDFRDEKSIERRDERLALNEVTRDWR